MALPVGVTTCTVTYGSALTAVGEVSSISATLMMDRLVVWEATGQSINSGNDPITADSGEALSFAVPHVDQDGFILPGGDAATLWSYTLTGVVTYATGHKQTFRKPFQVFVGETVLDLDTVADDAAVLDAVIVERERVLSVNGDVGHVTVEGGGGGTGTVESVNGDVGPDVVLDAADVGADPTGSAAAAQAAAIAAAATDATTKASAAQTAAVASAATYTDTAVSAEASARATAISTAINNLVASAPGVLDTLDELAAALGDDPNFAATITTALATKQPVDSDLTAIAALTTTTFGRALLTLADAAAGRTALALGTAATSNTGDFQPVDSDLTAIAALTTTAYGRGFLDLADAAAARTKLALGTAATVNTGTASGDVPLLSTGGVLPIARLATGTPDGTKFVRDDGALAVPAGGYPTSFADASITTTWVAPAVDQFRQVTLATENSDPGNNYSTVTSYYVVPTTGLYLCLARLRTAEVAGSTQFGMGVHTSNADGAWFQWQTVPSGGARYTANYQRLAYFTAGDSLRLFVYVVSGAATQTFQAGAMNILRVG